MDEDITDGPLLERVRAACAEALASGALGPIDTREERCSDAGIGFRLRTVASLARKQAAERTACAGDADPFAPPYEPGLHVGPVRPAHVGLLNKFPVLDAHLLVVTRDWARQDGALARGDCEALLRVLAAGDGLAFYNSGETAGASQPHRHLQWVGLGDERPPLESPLAAGHTLAFPYAAEPLPTEWLDDPATGADAFHACYARLLAAIGRASHGRVPPEPAPYNLAATRDTVWVVPRRTGNSGPVAVNGLGYAGYMLAADDEQADHIRRRGPLALLADAADRRPRPTE